MLKLKLMKTHPLHYILTVPEGVEQNQEKVFPVLLFLHGLDEGPPAGIFAGVTAHGPLRIGSASAATREFVIAAPQLPARGDHWRLHGDVVRDIAKEVQEKYQGDPQRTYLTGFSFGGNGVFDIALLHRDLWAALWPVDPTRVPEGALDTPIWLSSGEVSRSRSQLFVSRLGLEPPGAVPGDRVYDDEGLDHVGTATAAYSNEAIYQWLMSKSRG